jgi:hypothetical protein
VVLVDKSEKDGSGSKDKSEKEMAPRNSLKGEVGLTWGAAPGSPRGGRARTPRDARSARGGAHGSARGGAGGSSPHRSPLGRSDSPPGRASRGQTARSVGGGMRHRDMLTPQSSADYSPLVTARGAAVDSAGAPGERQRTGGRLLRADAAEGDAAEARGPSRRAPASGPGRTPNVATPLSAGLRAAWGEAPPGDALALGTLSDLKMVQEQHDPQSLLQVRLPRGAPRRRWLHCGAD